MEKHLVVNMAKCTGCKLCELACSAIKTGKFNPRQAKLQVCLIDIPEIPVPIILDSCDYCFGNPACVPFCLPKALEWKDVAHKPDRPKLSDAKQMAHAWLASVSK